MHIIWKYYFATCFIGKNKKIEDDLSDPKEDSEDLSDIDEQLPTDLAGDNISSLNTVISNMFLNYY